MATSSSASGISRFENRVAVVTGASVGIGKAICRTLVQQGLIVVGCARKAEPIAAAAEEYQKLGYKGKLHSYKCDVGKDAEVIAMFQYIESKFGGVDVCVNNAGFAVVESLLDSNPENVREMFNVNVVGLILCTKLAIKSMMDRGVNDGHVLQINSVLGHQLRVARHCYSSTKFAVTALCEGFRKELAAKNSRIRVTSISPGMTHSQFHYGFFEKPEDAEEMYGKTLCLDPQDVANAVLHALSQPANVLVHDITFEATGVVY